MIHPHTELRFINKEIGSGVVATKFIPAGTITWVFDKLDREFTKSEVLSMDPLYQELLETYCFRNKTGKFILCWDHGRFVNHSFKSNCLTTAYDFEIAIRDIHPGEELTDDYGYLNISAPFKALDENAERKIVYPDDLLNFHKVWDKQIAAVFSKINSLEQPLYPIITSTTRKEINDVLNGSKKLASILENYYKEV